MRSKHVVFLFMLVYLLSPTTVALGQEEDSWYQLANFNAILIDRNLSDTTTADGLINLRTSFDKHMNNAVRDYNDVITTAINQSSNSDFDPDMLDGIITRTTDQLAELQELRVLILEHLDARIKIAERDERVFNIITSGIIHQTITDGAGTVDPNNPPELNPVVTNYQAIRHADAQSSALHGLNATIADNIPGSSFVVDSMSATIYDYDAGLPPSSSSVVVQQDSEPTELPPAETPTVSPNFPETAPQNGGSAITTHKPVRFTNDGSYSATVVVSSYSPPPNSFAQDTNASTVVFPGGNSSGQLSLPIGEYTFCYYWELDGDVDNDGYVDYAHKTTGKVTLSANSPDSANSAQVVNLHPENQNNPNGKCDGSENFTPPSNPSSLTPQELVNEGSHTYFCSLPDLGDETVNLTITFGENSFRIDGFDASHTLQKIGTNTYTGEGDTVTFSDWGFSAENNVAVMICTIQ